MSYLLLLIRENIAKTIATIPSTKDIVSYSDNAVLKEDMEDDKLLLTLVN